MAKATIKMCQTTASFGSQMRFPSEPPSSSPVLPQGFETSVPTSVLSAGSILANSRPPPQFDYNLKDLFPEADLPMRRFGQTEDSTNAGWIQHRGQAPAHQYHYHSPAPTNTSLTSSNPTPNHSSVTSNPQPTFRQPSYGNHTAQSQSQQQQQQQQAQHYDPHLMTTAAIPNFDGNAFDFSNSTDFDFLLNHHDSIPPPTYNGDAASGLNFGFDGRADWSGNGEMPDLFGGFFFGGGPGPMDGMEFGDGGDEHSVASSRVL